MGWFDWLFNKNETPKYKEGQKGVDKTGKPIIFIKGKWYIDHSRKKDNTSKTSVESQYLEDKMHENIIARQKQRNAKGASQTWKYAIPYIEDKEITLSGTKNHNGLKVTTNQLDSVAKYAKLTGTPIITALGLPFQETNKGNHIYYNFSNTNKQFNRNLGNTEYLRNFGIMPAENYVNDHEYTDGGYNNGKPIIDKPPLQHAFEHFNLGRYNPGDPNHTKDVLNTGKDIWLSPEIQEWWNNSEYKFKHGGSIHIKEKNKGKFTEYCGGKVTNECIQKAKNSGNPKLVKRATFAQNVRKWHKK